jgi:hypothetical protein
MFPSNSVYQIAFNQTFSLKLEKTLGAIRLGFPFWLLFALDTIREIYLSRKCAEFWMSQPEMSSQKINKEEPTSNGSYGTPPKRAQILLRPG